MLGDMNARRWAVSLGLLLALVSGGSAVAAQRVALVLANGAYVHAPPLPNAARDGAAMAEALRRIGFEVYEGLDLSLEASRGVLRDFAYALADAELALFFYAGHGLQVGGENYVVPVDARLEQELDLAFQALPLSQITGAIEREDRTAILILDACRDNPFVPRISRTLSRSRTTGQGLAEISPGLGTLVVFATDPGKVAFDGQGENSPFTAAFLRYAETPGLEVRQLMTRVRRDVLDATDGAQRPWDNSSLLSDVYLVPAVAEPAAEAAPPAPLPPAIASGPTDEQRYWDGVQQIADPALKGQALDAYLAEFPQGRFAKLAELQLAALRAEPPTVMAALPEMPGPQGRDLPAEAIGPPASPAQPADVAPVDPAAVAEAALALELVEIRRVQGQLGQLGYAVGRPDGVIGPRTRSAIAAFQKRQGLAGTGFLNEATLDQLRQSAAAVAVAPPAAEQPRPTAPAAPRENRAAASRGEPAPGTMVACRGPNDPSWVDYRLITYADCKRIGGRWSEP
jgi:Caspase domain/Putative peptidoglycan binding domain